jgi:hypothetical protein
MNIFDLFVQRERGEAETLAPRLATVFEPVAPAAQEDEQSGPANLKPAAATATPAAAPSPASVNSSPASVGATAARAVAGPAPHAPAEQVRAPARGRDALPPPALPRDARMPAAKQAAHVATPLAVQPIAAQPRAPLAATALADFRPPAAPVMPAPPAPATPASRPRKTVPAPHVRSQAAAVVTPQRIPAATLRPPARSKDPAQALAPDVNITIGRVEVRLPAPAPRASRQPAGMQPMSLDQDLGNRNKREPL